MKNLRGGHYGGDIHLGLGNANKILHRFLWQTSRQMDMVLCHFDGGNLRNAIPREATAIIGVPSSKKETLRVDLNIYTAEIEAELAGVEPNVELVLESVDSPTVVIDRQTTANLLNALYACPHGVIKMSNAMPGLVETSTNLAPVNMKAEQTIVVATHQRSLVESEK